MHTFFVIELNHNNRYQFGPYTTLKQALEVMLEYREVLLANQMDIKPEDKYSIAVIEYTLEYDMLNKESYWKPIVTKIEELHDEY